MYCVKCCRDIYSCEICDILVSFDNAVLSSFDIVGFIELIVDNVCVHCYFCAHSAICMLRVLLMCMQCYLSACNLFVRIPCCL